MARKPLVLPTGVDIKNGAIRIRFTWNKQRYSEILPFPVSQSGLAAAAKLRAEVVQLIKLGLFDEAKYQELFPNSSKSLLPASGENFLSFTQQWLDNRPIAEGTRNNYKSLLNRYWMPYLGPLPLKAITLERLEAVVAETDWTSPQVFSAAVTKLRTVLNAAVKRGLIPSNPAVLLELPKRKEKKVDPFSKEEADRIIQYLYSTKHWPSLIYGAYFEFVFYTGMRLSEALALRWDEIDWHARTAYVCRTVALGKIEERTKTGKNRTVLLNDRAMHALEFALKYRERRLASKVSRVKELPYCFPPGKGQQFVKQTSDLHKHFVPALKALGIRRRPPYNCRHTYATVCIMAGMTPAFIAKQLGHSVQMLLSTYATWIDSDTDWQQMQKLNLVPNWSQTEKDPSETLEIENP